MKHARCAFLAVSLLTVGNILRAEEGSRLPENTHSAPNGSALPANTVASSANTSVPASANGSGSSLTGITVQDAEANSPSAVGTQAVASNTTSSVGTSASNTASPSPASVAPGQTAPTNAANNVSSASSVTTSTTASRATETSGATTSNATPATSTTTSAATTFIATGAAVSANPATGITTSATSSVSTLPNTANSSQTSPAPTNIPLGLSAGSDASTAPPTPEEEESQDLGDILDLRPPAKLKVSLLPWVIALLIVLSAIGLWFLLKRKRHGKAKKEKPTKPIDPYEEVLRALKEASQKLDVNNPKLFAFFLTDAVRLYLSRVFRLPAPESTTQELLEQLPWCTELTDDLRTNITQFLQRCDLVKFTTMPFDEPFLLQLYRQAEQIVAVSREITKPKPTPVAPAAPNATPSSEPEKTSKK